MKKHITLIVTSLIVIATTIYCSINIISNVKSYKNDKIEISEVLNFKERLLSTEEWLPFTNNVADKLELTELLNSQANEAYGKAAIYGWILGAIVLLYLIINGFKYYKTNDFNNVFGTALVISSFCFISLGLQTPFIEVEAFNTDLEVKAPIEVDFDKMPLISYLGLGKFEYDIDKTFPGKIYYFYQNKSIFQLISLLFSGGNILVGLALVFFSILFPLFKLIATLFFFLSKDNEHSSLLVKVVKFIGKWSMADVFVAGIFLAVFAFKNMETGVQTEANTLIGLYFYFSFVMLSIVSTYFIRKPKQLQISTSL